MAVYDVNGNVLNEGSAFPSLSLFNSIGVIGDSYASGEIYIDGLKDYYDLSWPQTLGRMAGLKAVNYTKGGLSTKNWLENNDYGLGKLNSEDANDIYVIALGLNDANQSIPIGTISDITSDSTNSFYSYFGRIIRAIQSHAPNAIIMVSTLARWNTTYNQYSVAVKAIGEYYSFSVIDLDSSDFFKSSFFADNMVGNHPTAVNYSAMAKEYGRLIELALEKDVQNYNGYTQTVESGKQEDIIPENVKSAMLDCFAHIAWIDNNADYYSILVSALYPTRYPKITAEFDSGLNVIYTDDSLDSLKQYLTVKYYANDKSTGVALSDNDYTLSGVLTEGLSTVYVSYDNLVVSFAIEGVVDYYDTWMFSMSSGNLDLQGGGYEPNQDDLTKYPSRLQYYDNASRKCVSVKKGKAGVYLRNQAAQATGFYPVPVPPSANHVKITINPGGQYIYMHTLPYIADTNRYGNSIAGNRIVWSEMTGGVIEKDITNTGNLFLCCNFKYDNAGSTYPSNPSNITIEYSEV